MVHQAVIIALALTGSAVAHSAVPLVAGDVGGSMTGLGINPSIPVLNANKDVIEPDANTMPSNRNPNANGLGTLNQKKKVTMDMLPAAVKNAGGTTVPQVDTKLKITYRQMVLDGRFDQTKGAAVLIDPTATGNFANAIPATVDQAPQVVKTPTIKGTTVVGQDMPMTVTIPANVQCTGPQNTCLVRVVNGKNEGNNLWGGTFVFQKADPNAAPAAAGSAAGASKFIRSLKTLIGRDEIQLLARDLKKIQVREEVEPRDENDKEVPHPTYDDMIKFEKENQ